MTRVSASCHLVILSGMADHYAKSEFLGLALDRIWGAVLLPAADRHLAVVAARPAWRVEPGCLQERLQRSEIFRDLHFLARDGHPDDHRQPAADRTNGLLGPAAPAGSAPGRRVHHLAAVRGAGDRAGVRPDQNL